MQSNNNQLSCRSQVNSECERRSWLLLGFTTSHPESIDSAWPRTRKLMEASERRILAEAFAFFLFRGCCRIF